MGQSSLQSDLRTHIGLTQIQSCIHSFIIQRWMKNVIDNDFFFCYVSTQEGGRDSN